MSKTRIFGNYITALGSGSLRNVSYKNLDVWAIINPLDYLFNVKVIKDNDILEKLLETKENKSNEYVNIKKFKDYKLLKVKEKSFNKDTLEDSEHTYQEMRNENVQEYVFSEDENKKIYCKYSPIKKSLDYKDAVEVYNYDHAIDKGDEPTEAARTRYKALITDYSINDDGYSKTNFSRLNVNEDQIIESEIALTADDFVYTEYNSKDKILNHGIYGFYLSIKDKDKKNIPVMMYLFNKPTYSNYNKIKLVFNADGLFGVV